MSTPKQLADRLREVILNGTFIAFTNFKDQLDQVTLQQANQKVGSLNTIALLTFHINYYLGGVNNFFEKGALEIRDKYSFDMPEIKSNEDWQKLKQALYTNAETFATHVEALDENILQKDFVDPKYGPYIRNINGMIEHAYYHLGQVSLLKKMIEIEC